jgi:hypothetical protein
MQDVTFDARNSKHAPSLCPTRIHPLYSSPTQVAGGGRRRALQGKACPCLKPGPARACLARRRRYHSPPLVELEAAASFVCQIPPTLARIGGRRMARHEEDLFENQLGVQNALGGGACLVNSPCRK